MPCEGEGGRLLSHTQTHTHTYPHLLLFMTSLKLAGNRYVTSPSSLTFKSAPVMPLSDTRADCASARSQPASWARSAEERT